MSNFESNSAKSQIQLYPTTQKNLITISTPFPEMAWKNSNIPPLTNKCWDIIVSFLYKDTDNDIDHSILWCLKPVISTLCFAKYTTFNTLLYGQVQSGKTQQMINLIQRYRTILPEFKIVILIQNSLLVLKQYQERFSNNNISYQVIDAQSIYIENTDVILILGNTYRINNFYDCDNTPEHYILFRDEADVKNDNSKIFKNSYKCIDVTATPKDNIIYKKRIIIHPKSSYHGITECNNKIQLLVTFKTETTDENIVKFTERLFARQNGILLMNNYFRFSQMKTLYLQCSKIFTNTPIILLTSKRSYMFNNKNHILPDNMPINHIIDKCKKLSNHIIIIAGRLASRGLSYVSTDYKLHITDQICTFKSRTSFLQSLRICGNYDDQTQLNLIIILKNKTDIAKINNAIDFIHKNFKSHIPTPI